MNNLSGTSVIEAILKVDEQDVVFIDLPGHQISIGSPSDTAYKQIASINKILCNFEMTMEAIKHNKQLIPYRNSLATKINIKNLKDNTVFLIVHVNPFDKESIQTLTKANKFI